MQPAYRHAAVTAATFALVIGVCPVASAAPSPSSPTRVVKPEPRINTLEPRIVDIRPKQSKKTYTVESDVLFAFDSATLAPGAANSLDQVIATLDKQGSSKVTIVGYTDSIGTTTYNLDLSKRRAASVRAYLEKNARNSELEYESLGRGEAKPVAANKNPDGSDNPTGRRMNRRVTITYV